MQPLPVELIQHIVALVDQQDLYNLLYASRQFRLIVDPFLYSDVSFTQSPERYILSRGACFLCAISADRGRRRCCVKRIALPIMAFEDRFYQPTFRLILQSLPCLQHLWVQDFSFMDRVDLLELITHSSGPFSLKSLSWNVRMPTLDARFVDAQLSLERLHIPYVVSPLKIGLGGLAKLRVLEAPLDTALDIMAGRQVTHLKIAASGLRDASIVDEAIQHVVVCAMAEIPLHSVVSLASRMPNLEFLEVDTYYAPVGDTLRRIVALKGTKLRHIRFARDGVYNTAQIMNAFRKLPNIACISISTSVSTRSNDLLRSEYDFFFRGAPEPRRLRALDAKSTGHWWQDWEGGFGVVGVERT